MVHSPVLIVIVGRIGIIVRVQVLTIILLVVLVIFGGSQIPKLARSLGQAQKEFKTGLDEGAKDDGKDGEKGQ
jgi:sec-independent protein translocase protein TatA